MCLPTPNTFALATVSASVFRLALRADPSNLPGSFEWPGRAAFLAQRGGEDEGAWSYTVALAPGQLRCQQRRQSA